MGFDGIVYCEVLEVVPFRRLRYSWRGGPGKGKITLDSMVTWTLTQAGTGTDLVLEHTGFRGVKNFLAWYFMNAGWGSKIRKRLTSLTAQATGKSI